MAPADRPASAPIPPSPASSKETDLLPAAHLTCVGAARGEIDDIVGRYHDIGVRHIVALRGDPPGGIGTRLHRPIPTATRPRPNSSPASSGACRYRGLGLRLSGEASGKPRLRCRHRHAARPRSMPAPTRAITQVFFDNDLYFRYLDRVRARGIDYSDRARHHADAQFQAGAQFRHPRRHHRAGLARGKIRRPRRRCRDPQAGGGDRRRRPGAEARQARRRHLSFLHHEPRRPRVRDQPSARHPPARAHRKPPDR